MTLTVTQHGERIGAFSPAGERLCQEIEEAFRKASVPCEYCGTLSAQPRNCPNCGAPVGMGKASRQNTALMVAAMQAAGSATAAM